MRSTGQAGLIALMCGASLGLAISSARGQAGGLGGYGAMAGASGGAGMSSSTVAPFGGRIAASVPASLGSGTSLSFRPRPSATMSPNRTAGTIGPMGGASSSGTNRRPFVLRDLGSGGMAGLGMRRSMPNPGGMSVLPPSFAAPFRQPPSLVPPAAGPGSSM